MLKSKENELLNTTLNSNILLKYCDGHNFDKQGYLNHISSLNEQALEDRISSKPDFPIIVEFGAFRKELEILSCLIHAQQYYNDNEYYQDKTLHLKNHVVNAKSCNAILKKHSCLNNKEFLVELSNFVYNSCIFVDVKKNHKLFQGISEYKFLTKEEVIPLLRDKYQVINKKSYFTLNHPLSDRYTIVGMIAHEEMDKLYKYLKTVSLYGGSYEAIYDLEEVLKSEEKENLINKVKSL